MYVLNADYVQNNDLDKIQGKVLMALSSQKGLWKGPTVLHRDPYSMSSGSLDERGVCQRTDTSTWNYHNTVTGYTLI